jgi:hypothetical protein
MAADMADHYPGPMKAFPLALIAGIVVLTMTGCAPGSAGSNPSGHATTDADSTPSSTPSATPTPVQDPTDPTTWIISADGIGPARIGEPVADIVAQLTEYQVPADAASACFNTAITYLAAPGGSVSTAPLLLAANPDGTLWGVAVGSPGPHGISGIEVGSSVADVRVAYPTATDENRYSGAPNLLTVRGTPGWISWEYDGGTQITLAQVNAGGLPPNEYCG